MVRHSLKSNLIKNRSWVMSKTGLQLPSRLKYMNNELIIAYIKYIAIFWDVILGAQWDFSSWPVVSLYNFYEHVQFALMHTVIIARIEIYFLLRYLSMFSAIVSMRK